MSRDNQVVTHFVHGLKSRSQQNKTAQELLLYVKTELREMPQEELLAFLDDFNHSIFDMISSADNTEKKGGVLAISEFRSNASPAGSIKIFSFRMPGQRRCCQHDHEYLSIPQHSSRSFSVQRRQRDGAGGKNSRQTRSAAWIQRR
jgi:hypothetical protein